jgi:hypothetical protein
MVPKIKFISLIGLLIPFEMVFAYAAHGILAPYISDFYKLFLFGNIVFLCIFAYFLTKIKSASFSINVVFALLPFNLLGLWEVFITIVNNSFITESVTQLFLGFISPSLITLFVLNRLSERKSDFFYSFYFGYLLLYCVAIITTIYYYNTFPSWYRESEVPFQLFMFRSLIDGVDGVVNPFQIFMGNFNKASNYIIFLCLFSFELIDTVNRPRFIIIFWVMSFFILVVLFSRIALMIFPFVYYISGFHSFLRNKIKLSLYFKILALVVCIVILRYNYSTYKPAIDYLVFSKINEDSQSSVLGSGESRFSQWSYIYEKYVNFENILGMGHQEFSIREYGYLHGGSHNLFIDHYLASGLPSLLLLGFLMLYIFFKGIMRKNLLTIASVIIFILLSFREYTFSYLNASIQGGLFFATLIFLSINSQKSTRVS